jgi:hypothetical protein
VVTHEDCGGCDYRGHNLGAAGLICNLWDGLKRPEEPCPDPKWRDEVLKAKRLKEGKYDPV